MPLGFVAGQVVGAGIGELEARHSGKGAWSQQTTPRGLILFGLAHTKQHDITTEDIFELCSRACFLQGRSRSIFKYTLVAPVHGAGWRLDPLCPENDFAPEIGRTRTVKSILFSFSTCCTQA